MTSYVVQWFTWLATDFAPTLLNPPIADFVGLGLAALVVALVFRIMHLRG